MEDDTAHKSLEDMPYGGQRDHARPDGWVEFKEDGEEKVYYWHEGTGIAYYRCVMCHKPVSEMDVNKGGCQNCGCARVRPTSLSLKEKIIEIVKNPSILKGLFVNV